MSPLAMGGGEGGDGGDKTPQHFARGGQPPQLLKDSPPLPLQKYVIL